MATLDDVRQHALTLDVDERAALAEELLASLEDLPEHEAERLWADEAKRRLDLYGQGRARAVPAAEVHAKAEKLLGG